MKGDTDNQLCAEVNERGCYLLETAQYLDCTFLVGVEPHQEEIASHKLILALASCVFEAMFYGDLLEKSHPIHIIDIQPETFKLLLQYVYTGHMKVNSVHEACNLYYAAKKYMLQHLLEECSLYLWNRVDTSNVWQVFEFAELYEDKELLLKCEKIFSVDTMDVLNDSKFEDAGLNTVLTVFSYNNLNIDCETDLIKAAARYAKAHNMRVTGRDVDQSPSGGSFTERSSSDLNQVNGVKAENSTEPVVETLNVGDAHKQLECGAQPVEPSIEDCVKIKRIAKRIRFLCLTPEEFAECPERTSILTISEENAVIMNIASRKCNVPYPKGFSQWTSDRNNFEECNDEKSEARVQGAFNYTVSGFNFVMSKSSPPYYMRNLSWRFNVMREDKGCRLSLHCNGQDEPSWSCELKMTLTIYSVASKDYEDYVSVAIHLFCKESDTYFFPTKSINWDRYMDKSDKHSVVFHLSIEEEKAIDEEIQKFRTTDENLRIFSLAL